jgi:hypothetical protein
MYVNLAFVGALLREHAFVTHSTFDAGNLVASFEREAEAYEALESLAAASADARDGLLLVAFDDAGNVIADCARGERIVTAA